MGPRILHITNMFSQGGVDSLLMDILPRLNDNATPIELLVLNKSHADMAPYLEQRGVKVHLGKYKNVYNPLNIFVIRHYIKNYDIVHTHLFPTQLYAVVAKMLLKRKPVFVTTEHCTTNNRRSHRWLRPIDRFMYRRYNKIVGVCQAAVDNLAQWVGTKDRIITINNGIPLDKFAGSASYSNLELGLPEDAKKIVMVARFFNQKDHLTAIRAMAEVRSSKVHLLFAGSGDTMAACMALAKELGLNTRVHFLGRRDDIGQLLASADVCLLSTFYEGLPISIIEYFASGKPVLATSVDGIAEMISDKSLLNKVEDYTQLAHNIDELLSNPEKMQQLSVTNLKLSKQYSIEAMVQQYKNLYI